jgi:predicted outer membrane repeat protein
MAHCLLQHVWALIQPLQVPYCSTLHADLVLHVQVRASNMNVHRSVFVNNSVVGIAGAVRVYAYLVPSVVTMSDTFITGNSATDGGAFHIDSSALHLRNCTIAGNYATDSGGAIHSTNSNVTATGTTFTRNSAAAGGAWSSSNGTLRLEGCNFAANHAYLGGALHMTSNCSAAVTSTTFANNTAVVCGGAISGIQGSNTSLVSCTFTGNSVPTVGGEGGAVHYLGAYNAVTASATQFEGNNASYGGAIASICPSTANDVDQLVHAATALGDTPPNPHYPSASLVWGALITAISLDACHSSLDLCLCSFKNNTASRGGGAVYVANGAGLNSSSSEFVLNKVLTGEGGGVLLESTSSLGCRNTSFRENQAPQGGAVAVTQSAQAGFSGGCVFSSNAGAEGGALWVDGSRVVLQGSAFRNNTAQQGGGLMVRNVAEVALGQDMHLVGNAAQLFGGAMLVDFECVQQVRLVLSLARCQLPAAVCCCCNAPATWSDMCDVAQNV